MAGGLRRLYSDDKTERKVRSCQGSHQKMCETGMLFLNGFSREIQPDQTVVTSTVVCLSYRSLAVTPSWVQSSRRTPAWCVEDKTPPACTTRACTRATVWRQVGLHAHGHTHAHAHTYNHHIISTRNQLRHFQTNTIWDNSQIPKHSFGFPSPVSLVIQD